VVAIAFAVPGSLDQPTGGYTYDRRVVAGLRKLGCTVDVVDLGEGFPHPAPGVADAAVARLCGIPRGRPIIIDGLALGVLPEGAQALRASHPVIALVHHPLALESGLAPETAERLRVSERAALAAVRHVVVTSPATARLLAADYGVAAAAITVGVPGNDAATIAPLSETAAASIVAPSSPSPRLRGEGRGEGLFPLAARTVNLLSVGSVVRRKGHDVLIAALARLVDLDWHLTIAGDCTRERETAGDLATRIVQLRLGPRVRITGALAEAELACLYREADLFVLASRFEGYGMAFTEAIVHGLPVVGTKAGAIPDTVPEGTGLLVAPDDVAGLAAALRTMIADEDFRARCAEAARVAAARLPTWDATAQIFLDVLGRVATRGTVP
jgi:glycosyltransferase involved in cell wall biosynthesis